MAMPDAMGALDLGHAGLFPLEYALGRAIESAIERHDAAVAKLLVRFLIERSAFRATSWQRWLDFCRDAPGTDTGISLKDLLDDEYRRP